MLYMRYLRKMGLFPTCTSQPPSKRESLEEPGALALESVQAGQRQPLLTVQPAQGPGEGWRVVLVFSGES